MLRAAVRANTSEAFETFVDRLAAAAALNCRTFSELVDFLPGIPPDETLASLRRLNRGSDCQHLEYLVADANRDRAPPYLDQGRGLPLPHPLDSEFRFDAETAERLANGLIAA